MSELLDFNVPVPASAEHKLEGPARKKWRKTMERVAGHQLTFIATLPFFCALMISQTGPQGYPIAYMCIVVWIIMFAMMAYSANKQLRHSTQVSTAGDGLHVEAWWMKRKIPWGQIKEFYCVDGNEYVVQLQDDEQFFLAKDLTNFDTLVQQIEANISKPADKFFFCTRSPEELNQGQKAAFLAIWIASTFSFVQRVVFSKSITSPESLTYIASALAITTGMILVYRACQKSFAHQLRIGPDGLSLFFNDKEKRLRWGQIRSMQKFLTILIIRHEDGVAFVPFFHFPNPKELSRLMGEEQERLKLTMSK